MKISSKDMGLRKPRIVGTQPKGPRKSIGHRYCMRITVTANQFSRIPLAVKEAIARIGDFAHVLRHPRNADPTSCMVPHPAHHASLKSQPWIPEARALHTTASYC